MVLEISQPKNSINREEGDDLNRVAAIAGIGEQHTETEMVGCCSRCDGHDAPFQALTFGEELPSHSFEARTMPLADMFAYGLSIREVRI